MALNLYHTLTKKVETFTSRDGENVGMYTCGPTVYNYAHIGNFRAYMAADIAKRVLGYVGFEVTHIMNLTDVDDKTIRDSQASGKSLEEFTTFFAEEFKKDLALLNIVPPTNYTRAVEHIPEMVSLIEKLVEKGFAYATEDGSVYFNIEKDTHYGQLSTIVKNEQLENAAGRIKLDEYEKDNANDFALWKAWDESDGDVFWETSLGKGRPGWHIECSAMSMQYLGESFDIHTGGVDLIFPHHENEIALSECATGKQFVRYWLHNEWVMVEGKKMSKSAGNFATLRTITDKNIPALAFRLLVLMSHYRSPLNFTWDALAAAETALARIKNQTATLKFSDTNEEIHAVDTSYKTRFVEALENDLNTAAALAVLQELIHDKDLPPAVRFATALDFDRVLGLGLGEVIHVEIPAEITLLAQEREEARANKDWARSDELRAEIEAKGYTIKDTENGPLLSA
jgi:cysteinyl-tRNA synthetase